MPIRMSTNKKGGENGAVEMTQWFRASTALTEDLSSAPSIYNRWLTTSPNSSSRGSQRLLLASKGQLYSTGMWPYTDT